ncbi:serine/threonine protein kinase [Chroogloeocystis siderophila]|jgi:serine/threonine protein kinase|uniref:Serine/threonine protein kinase n=1 Tax=Chroogloeocystis siderophila 5.2 s.c.1 TaxID=247279 RepID=A0A1U7I080_9CHRO|nr:serine/threonine-protein kinase [Chroogloeocystis siderophila]OKH29299.1 serine/threonine protein kinase [Chroogloeocystis siderophila 5.2 s.c.1]
MIERILQNRYKIQKQLGEHLDQKTLLAVDQQTRELVVIKLLIFNSNLKWETLKLFEREAKVLKELSHPAIPRYVDYFDIETTLGKGFALVQSYIDAPSLIEHTKRGRRFSETELKQIAKAVLEILIYLHNCYPPIIHRDIKPSNVLLANRSGNHVSQVYLVDFGSVQAAANEGGTKTIVGTYGYMPPEQFGDRAVPASDLYSLGATLIYLATGQHPTDLPQKNLRICFEKYASLSPSFIDWLQWMTEPTLEQRLESAHHALQALQCETLRKTQFLAAVKPPDSKVVLSKKHDILEIYIPPKGFSLELLTIIFFAILWISFLVNWYAMALSSWSSGGWFAAFFALGHLAVGIWLIIKILFAFFGQIWLRIDQEKIALKYQLFGLTYHHPRPALRQRVIKLERTQTSYRTDSDGGRVEVKPQINIWAGTRKFKIGGGGLLSEIELDWLAVELSDWLGLPISAR